MTPKKAFLTSLLLILRLRLLLIIFYFHFQNHFQSQIPSILANKTGVANRGIEFEIKLVWSIASGKHELFINNICISSSMLTATMSTSHLNYHQQRSVNKFDHTFDIPEAVLPGGHILHITIYSSNLQLPKNKMMHSSNDNHHQTAGVEQYPPSGTRNNNAASVEQQFILRFDGQRYNQFYRIFQLGNQQMINQYKHVLQKVQTTTTSPHDLHDVSSPSNMSYNSAPSNLAPGGGQLHTTQAQAQAHAQDATILQGRPRYKPNNAATTSTSTTNNNTHNFNSTTAFRGRSHTADNGILASEVARANNNQDAANRYWEKTSSHNLPTFIKKTKQTISSLSPSARNRLRKRFGKSDEYDTIDHNFTSNVHQYHPHHTNHDDNGWKAPSNQKFDRRDTAMNQHEEQQYIAKARLNSFRDLRGEQQSYDQRNDENDDNVSIPTFARPPRVIASKSNNHLKPVQESAADLLDDYKNNNTSDNQHVNRQRSNSDHGSISFPAVVRTTSSVTMDTALGGEVGPDCSDTVSVLTEHFSHLDPRQMQKTQANLSFRLQAPPVFADSLAGDLIQPTMVAPSPMGFGNNNNNNNNRNANMNPQYPSQTPAGITYQPSQQPQQQRYHQQYQNQQFQQQNAMNFAGRHMQMGFIHQPPLPNAHHHHQQQQQRQPVGFVPPPAPTWDALNNAFQMPQPQQRS